MKNLKPTKRPNPYVRKIMLTLRVNSEEMRTLIACSQHYTKGNIGEWIRYAAMNFKPAKKDLENGA